MKHVAVFALALLMAAQAHAEICTSHDDRGNSFPWPCGIENNWQLRENDGRILLKDVTREKCEKARQNYRTAECVQ